MVAKNFSFMNVLTDLMMTRLFQLAEYVVNHFLVAQVDSPSSAPILRFQNEDQMVEGELF